jgi:hypothetical protein
VPQTFEGQYDDSDYIATQGYFQPGSMLCNKSDDKVSAGILIEKGDERRLTVLIHCWQDELDKVSEKIGDPQFFRVKQSSTDVGYVSSRLGNTDIGLATLNSGVEFCNQFLDLPGKPTKLLRSDDIQAGSVFMMDSFVTGRQVGLMFRGVRTVTQEDKERRTDPDLKGMQKDLPAKGRYLDLDQGIFATSDPEAYGMPIVREGCCGSALVQLIESKRPQDMKSTQKTPKTKGTSVEGDSSTPTRSSGLRAKKEELSIENNGKIGGFMHLCDLQEKSTFGSRLYCYVEITEPLIEAGWEVVKTIEKRKRTSSEDPFVE